MKRTYCFYRGLNILLLKYTATKYRVLNYILLNFKLTFHYFEVFTKYIEVRNFKVQLEVCNIRKKYLEKGLS